MPVLPFGNRSSKQDKSGILSAASTQLPNPAMAARCDAKALADGTLAIACTTNINAVTDVSLARTDPWGGLTCTGSGACSVKPYADCDDANACTTDSCSALSGCGHAKTPDGIACGGGKVCAAGACK